MILDNLTVFCWQQAVTVSAASASYGTNGNGYIDLGPTDAFALNTNTGTELLGAGEPVNIEVLITTAMQDAGSPMAATVAVTLETADDSAFTSNKTTILTIGTFAAASAAKTRFIMRLPLGATYRRYLRIYFTVANGPLTAGKFSAYLCKDSEIQQMYPSRISIS